MSAADWIAVAAVLVAGASPVVSSAIAHARRDGKVDEVLDRLTGIAADHEGRLRAGGL